MKIDKNRTYTTRDGREVRIYATDGAGSKPVHLGMKNYNDIDGWSGLRCASNGLSTTASVYDLIEALKPNGIPVDLPDPPEVEGYTWEARGWGWKGDNVIYACAPLSGGWDNMKTEMSLQPKKTSQNDRFFYVEYTKKPAIEMTLAEVCEALGKTVKIVK